MTTAGPPHPAVASTPLACFLPMRMAGLCRSMRHFALRQLRASYRRAPGNCICKAAVSGPQDGGEHLADVAHAIGLAQDAVHAGRESARFESRAAVSTGDHDRQGRIELADLDGEL